MMRDRVARRGARGAAAHSLEAALGVVLAAAGWQEPAAVHRFTGAPSAGGWLTQRGPVLPRRARAGCGSSGGRACGPLTRWPARRCAGPGPRCSSRSWVRTGVADHVTGVAGTAHVAQLGPDRHRGHRADAELSGAQRPAAALAAGDHVQLAAQRVQLASQPVDLPQPGPGRLPSGW